MQLNSCRSSRPSNETRSFMYKSKIIEPQIMHTTSVKSRFKKMPQTRRFEAHRASSIRFERLQKTFNREPVSDAVILIYIG